ncbi:MAG: UMP kinase [Clostridia bacterium]|nr:UMP kinase [Clostridia bacterium]
MMSLKYNRILLKLSGESLAGDKKFGINNDTVEEITAAVKECYDLGAEIAIVVGGGNFWRGRSSEKMDRAEADYIGMLATVMNSLCLCDMLKQKGVPAVVQTSIPMQQIAEPFVRRNALKYLDEKKVVIFGGGTGSPFFSTDTAAALRATEINADAILKATMVDGVYDSDPKKNPDAKRYSHISFSDVLKNNLAVMDSTAATLCKDNNIPILVFSIADPLNIKEVIQGKDIATLVSN